VDFRAATPDDAAAIAGLVVAVAHHAYADLEPVRVHALEPEDETAAWEDRLADPAANLVRVGAAGGRMVAAASWRVARRTAQEPVEDGVLTHLLVHPAAQNAGVGGALLTDAEDALRGLGGTTATLSLHPEAWWAARFLTARGWERDAEPPAASPSAEGWRRSL
jgi:GNAT superfamily N-acetyltransferase